MVSEKKARQKFISLETGYDVISRRAVAQDYLRTDRTLTYNYDSDTYAKDTEGNMYRFKTQGGTLNFIRRNYQEDE